MKKHIAGVLLILALLHFRPAPGGPPPSTSQDPYFEIIKNLEVFLTVFKEVNGHYVDGINPEELINIGIEAMLASLDPYTDFISEDDAEDFLIATTGEYGGIGASIENINRVSTIVLPYEGKPAQRVGIRAGDQVIRVDGNPTLGKNPSELSRWLKGQAGTQVEVVVRRPYVEDSLTFTLVREKIKIGNVSYAGILDADQAIGYIRLRDFTQGTGGEVIRTFKTLKKEGMEKLILDLRSNPGGVLSEAVAVSGIFIPRGKEVVTTRGRNATYTRTFRTPSLPLDKTMRVVVLVDSNTASAAEIVAGVLQDYDRAVTVGRKTFGKGLVQQTRPLVFNSQLKVTTAKYYIPSGRCIQVVDYSDSDLPAESDTLMFRTKGGRLVFGGGGITPDVAVEKSPRSRIAMDLRERRYFFKHATLYFSQNPAPANVSDFRLLDTDYDGFLAWLQQQSYHYVGEVEEKIRELTLVASKSPGFQVIEPLIENISKIAIQQQQELLNSQREELTAILEAEILSRYFYEKGYIVSSFSRDLDMKEAIGILNDPPRYDSLLQTHDP